MEDSAPRVMDRVGVPAPPSQPTRSQRPGTTLQAFILVALLALVALAVLVPVLAVVIAVVAAVCVGAAVLARSSDRMLQLLVISMFFESVTIGGVTVGRILAAIVVVVLIWRLALTRWRPYKLAPLTVLAVIAYAGWILASGYWSKSSSGWVFAVGQLALALAYFAGFALFVQTPEQLTRLFRTFVIGAVLISVLAFWQAYGNQRAEGLQGDPNLFAVYQVAAIPAALALARQSLRHRRWWALALIPLIISILASDSRGGLIALGVMLVFMMWRGELRTTVVRKMHPLNAALAFVVVIFAGALAVSFNSRLNISRIGQDRGSGRLDIWYAAWKAFLRHPLNGIGGGQFKVESIDLLQTTPGVQLIKSHLLLSPGIEVHNVYLETITEYGVVGGIIYVALLVGAFRNLRFAERHFGESVVSALTPMLLAFAIASIFLSVSNNKLFWMLIGVSVAFRAMPSSLWKKSRPRVIDLTVGPQKTGAVPLR